MKKEYRNLLIIGIFFIVFVILFISKFDYNLSSTIELSDQNLGAFKGNLPHGLVVQINSTGFDGQYYYMMALNPTLEKIDISPHFFQRIIYPLLALILSFGIVSLIPFTLLFINYVSIILSSYIFMLLLKKYKANLNLVFFWAFNVGFLICIIRDLTTPLMILFVVAAIYFMEKQKHFISIVFLVLAILTRELALPIYAALLLYFFIKSDFKKIGLYSLAIIPFLIWEIILIFKTGTIPLLITFSSLTKPFISVFDYFFGTPSSIHSYIVLPILSQGQSVLSLDYLRPVHELFSPMPVLIFCFIQLIILIIVFFKDKKITKYTLLLLSQLAMIFSFKGQFFSNLEIDGIGRYAVPMFLFSIIYYVEKKEEYNRLLRGLSVILIVLFLFISIIYFINKIIIFQMPYYIT